MNKLLAMMVAVVAMMATGLAQSAKPAIAKTNDGTFVNKAEVQKAAANLKATPALAVSGTASSGYFPVFTDGSGDLTNSALFQVIAPTTTYLGFGTTNPSFNLHFVSTVDPAAVTIDGYGTVGINFIGRRAEGTLLNPTNLLANDNIMAMQGRGYGKTAFTPYSRAYMKFFAAENWSDTAQGTYISMATTTMGTAPATPAAERLRITDAGLIGIGTQSPTHTLGFGASATLGVEANPNAGGAGNSLSISAGAAASGATNQPGGDLFLAAGNGTGEGASGNLHLQSAGDAASDTAGAATAASAAAPATASTESSGAEKAKDIAKNNAQKAATAAKSHAAAAKWKRPVATKWTMGKPSGAHTVATASGKATAPGKVAGKKFASAQQGAPR